MATALPLEQGGAQDLELLSAWAEGKAGATQRISRRAWLVLESLRKRDPYVLGEVGSGTSRVHELLGRYRRMGVLGLLDDPRAGRPKSVDTNLNDALTEAGTFHPAAAAAVIRTLPKSVREAVWRENKKSGTTLERDRRMRTCRVAAPIGLPQLMGILSLPGLMVIVSASEPDSIRFSGGGVWLGERAIAENSTASTAQAAKLATAVQQAYAEAGHGARSAPSNARLVHEVFPRFHEWLEETTLTLEGQLTVDVAVAERNAPYVMIYLPALRAYLQPSGSTRLVRGIQQNSLQCRYRFSTYRTRASAARDQLGRMGVEMSRLGSGSLQVLSRDVFFCWMRAEVVDAEAGG